ncbi:hypothetical protein BpHYR1_040539 [Brachionus plicatilis]|uniref:Uncharacterized protein n=1 Tax=Brachionus plicatilis TaxID=10195 RepID=A0A3M7PI79_BRAPC|nr:hypothetical protein BpHYR1_040539 [Brachionus plicatilis]
MKPKQASKANKIRLNVDKSRSDSETEVQVNPFISLDQVSSSIDNKKIAEPIDRSEFLKGARIKLIHEVDNNHLMVNATIQSSKIFKPFLKFYFCLWKKK